MLKSEGGTALPCTLLGTLANLKTSSTSPPHPLFISTTSSQPLGPLRQPVTPIPGTLGTPVAHLLVTPELPFVPSVPSVPVLPWPTRSPTLPHSHAPTKTGQHTRGTLPGTLAGTLRNAKNLGKTGLGTLARQFSPLSGGKRSATPTPAVFPVSPPFSPLVPRPPVALNCTYFRLIAGNYFAGNCNQHALGFTET